MVAGEDHRDLRERMEVDQEYRQTVLTPVQGAMLSQMFTALEQVREAGTLSSELGEKILAGMAAAQTIMQALSTASPTPLGEGRWWAAWWHVPGRGYLMQVCDENKRRLLEFHLDSEQRFFQGGQAILDGPSSGTPFFYRLRQQGEDWLLDIRQGQGDGTYILGQAMGLAWTDKPIFVPSEIPGSISLQDLASGVELAIKTAVKESNLSEEEVLRQQAVVTGKLSRETEGAQKAVESTASLTDHSRGSARARFKIWMEIIDGAKAGQKVEVKDRLAVGRVSANALILPEIMVSRYHAIIEKTPEGYTLTDLGSSNGTLINGQPVKTTVPLSDGDVVTFGATRVRFHDGTSKVDCPHCGKSVRANAKFCSTCGKPIRLIERNK